MSKRLKKEDFVGINVADTNHNMAVHYELLDGDLAVEGGVLPDEHLAHAPPRHYDSRDGVQCGQVHACGGDCAGLRAAWFVGRAIQTAKYVQQRRRHRRWR